MRISFALLALVVAPGAIAQSAPAEKMKACEGPLSPKWTQCVGMHTFSWGHRFEGAWKDGKMHGVGKLYSETGALLQSGLWENGVHQIGNPPQTPKPPDTPASVNFNTCLTPTYPPGAQRSNAQGDTHIEYTLGPDGKISEAKITKSSGDSDTHKLLDLLALDAVKACTGTPQIRDGLPVQFSGAVNYTWRLTGPDHTDKTKAASRVTAKIDFNACERPEYTTAARRAETQGTVVVIYTIGIDGRVTEAHVERSSGPTREHKQLDRASLEAVKACRGTPAIENGVAVPSSGRTQFIWSLSKPVPRAAPFNPDLI
jgi:TonB family protein